VSNRLERLVIRSSRCPSVENLRSTPEFANPLLAWAIVSRLGSMVGEQRVLVEKLEVGDVLKVGEGGGSGAVPAVRSVRVLGIERNGDEITVRVLVRGRIESRRKYLVGTRVTRFVDDD
jgi:hypothetical protein